MYTLGRLAFPVVVAIIGVAFGVTLLSGLFVLMRLLAVLQHVLIKHWPKKRPTAYRVWVIPAARPALNPPMRERD